MGQHAFTSVEGQYLAFVAHLAQGEITASVSDFARYFEAAAEDVTQVLTSLASKGLIQYEDQSVRLLIPPDSCPELKPIRSPIEQHRKFVSDLLEPPNAEALHWLDKSKDHTLGELTSNAESQYLVLVAYEAGATHVLASDIDPIGLNSDDLRWPWMR